MKIEDLVPTAQRHETFARTALRLGGKRQTINEIVGAIKAEKPLSPTTGQYYTVAIAALTVAKEAVVAELERQLADIDKEIQELEFGK
jgi:chaperonin cofactor prefoldin